MGSKEEMFACLEGVDSDLKRNVYIKMAPFLAGGQTQCLLSPSGDLGIGLV